MTKFIIAISLCMFTVTTVPAQAYQERLKYSERKRLTSLPRISKADIMAEGRPANIYSMDLDFNSKVCGPILDALNKPTKFEPIPFTGQAYYTGGIPLLKSELSVPVKEIKDSYERVVGRFVVDLDHDGVDEALYVKMSNLSSGYFNSSLWAKQFDEDEVSLSGGKETELYRTSELSGLRRESWRKYFTNQPYENDKGKPLDINAEVKRDLKYSSWVDVHRVQIDEHNSKDFLVKVPAQYPPHENSMFNPKIYVFSIKDAKTHMVECRFIANFVLER